jgi:hypothetical protein
VTYALSPRLSNAPQPIPSVEDPETTGTTAQGRNDVQKPNRQVKSESPRRQRATSHRKERRSPTMDYAAQPFLGGFRPWF